MAELVPLSAMKRHLRLDELDGEEDDYIAGLMIAARRSCEKHIDKSVAGAKPDVSDPDDQRVVSSAMMLLVGGWYANRESVSSGIGAAPVEMPMAVRWLLEPLRRMSV